MAVMRDQCNSKNIYVALNDNCIVILSAPYCSRNDIDLILLVEVPCDSPSSMALQTNFLNDIVSEFHVNYDQVRVSLISLANSLKDASAQGLIVYNDVASLQSAISSIKCTPISYKSFQWSDGFKAASRQLLTSWCRRPAATQQLLLFGSNMMENINYQQLYMWAYQVRALIGHPLVGVATIDKGMQSTIGAYLNDITVMCYCSFSNNYASLRSIKDVTLSYLCPAV